jgi:DNA polymerase III alpha subunit
MVSGEWSGDGTADRAPLTTHHPLPSGFSLEAERWPRILADARRLLGRPHHLSIHPGGVVLTPRPTEDYVPLQRAPKGIIISQFEKDAAEHIGLVKIDLLGNRALATVDEATHHCKMQNAKCKLQIANLPPDAATVALLQRGDTVGVNQLESPAMRHLLVQMRLRGLNDVIQALALIRPGAGSAGMKGWFVRRRRGLDTAAPLYQPVHALLEETEGLMIYEDDALRVIHILTGLPIPDADRFRKRVSKHKTEEEAQVLGGEFLGACNRNGIPEAVAVEMWRQLAKFRHYTFCKSHAVSYGLIAWTAAYLKAHHPVEFWTAALNNNQGVYPRRVYVEAVKRVGIEVRLPCVNRSQGPFTPEAGAIRVGLDAIATLTEELRSALLQDRQRRGPYQDLADFRRRLRPGPEALAALIRCGALDFTGQPRPALFLEADLQDQEQGEKGRRRNGEETAGTPFSPFLPFPFSPLNWMPADYSQERRLCDEWRLLGFIVGPPLMSLFRPRLPGGLTGSRELADCVGRVVRVTGLVATARYAATQSGESMQFITLEDEWGLIETTLFPGTCRLTGSLALGPYLATGLVEEQFGVLSVTVRHLERVLPAANSSE